MSKRKRTVVTGTTDDELLAALRKAREKSPELAQTIDLHLEVVSARSEIEAFAKSVAHISRLEELRVRATSAGFEISLIVNHASERIRYAFYDAEWELQRQFPHCTFDFHLIDRQGMDLSSLVGLDDETVNVPIAGADHAQ